MSDTPKTDEYFGNVPDAWNHGVAGFVRGLERERNALLAALKGCIAAMQHHSGRPDYWEGLDNARDKAYEVIASIEETNKQVKL